MSGCTPYIAAAWNAGVDDGIPTDMSRRSSRRRRSSRAMFGACPVASAWSRTARDRPSIWTIRKRRRAPVEAAPSHAQRARRSRNRWPRSTYSSIAPAAAPGRLEGRSPVGGLTRLEDPDALRVEPAPLDLGGDPLRRLIVALARQPERAPVDADHVRGPQVELGLERLLGRDVHGLGDLPRRVGADGQRGEIERPVGVSRL